MERDRGRCLMLTLHLLKHIHVHLRAQVHTLTLIPNYTTQASNILPHSHTHSYMAAEVLERLHLWALSPRDYEVTGSVLTLGMTQHSTAKHSTAQPRTAQHSTTQHSAAQPSTAQHCTTQHSTTLHSTAHHSASQTPLL